VNLSYAHLTRGRRTLDGRGWRSVRPRRGLKLRPHHLLLLLLVLLLLLQEYLLMVDLLLIRMGMAGRIREGELRVGARGGGEGGGGCELVGRDGDVKIGRLAGAERRVPLRSWGFRDEAVGVTRRSG
jgi:hypothetical protein